jgi:hypothetical protein
MIAIGGLLGVGRAHAEVRRFGRGKCGRRGDVCTKRIHGSASNQKQAGRGKAWLRGLHGARNKLVRRLLGFRGDAGRRCDCGIDRLRLGTLHWTPHRSSCSPQAARQRLGQHGTTTVCGNGRVDAGPFSVEVAGTWQESVSVVVGTSAAQGPGRGVVVHVPVCQGGSEVDGSHDEPWMRIARRGLARARLALASRQTSDAPSRCWTRCDVVKTLATRTYALTRMLLDMALLQRSALPANRTQRRRLAASRAAGRAVAGAGCAADEWPRLAAIEYVA